MKHEQKKLKFWRQESDQFEAIIRAWKNFDREMTDALCSARCDQFGIEFNEQTSLDTKIKALRRLFAVQTKHWKTIVRYPNLSLFQVMVLRFHPHISEGQKQWIKDNYNFKFPFKTVATVHPKNEAPILATLKNSEHTITRKDDVPCLISARYFVTNNNEINKISKNFRKTPSTSC